MNAGAAAALAVAALGLICVAGYILSDDNARAAAAGLTFLSFAAVGQATNAMDFLSWKKNRWDRLFLIWLVAFVAHTIVRELGSSAT